MQSSKKYYLMSTGTKSFMSESPMIGGKGVDGNTVISINGSVITEAPQQGNVALSTGYDNEVMNLSILNTIKDMSPMNLYHVDIKVSDLGSDVGGILAGAYKQPVGDIPMKSVGGKSAIKSSLGESNNGEKLYTDSDITLIKQMRGDKKTVKEIAKTLGRSTNATQVKVSKMVKNGELGSCQKNAKFTDEQDKAIINGRVAGITIRVLAEELGKTTSSVYSRMLKLKEANRIAK